MSDDEHEQTDPDDVHISVDAAVEATEQSLRIMMSSIETDVQESGWALVGHHQDAKCDGDGTFTYTIGMHRRGLPEIMTHGLCGCSDAVVSEIVRRQLRAGAFEDGQVTQILGTPVRLSRWPHGQHLRLLVEYYRHMSDAPSLLMVDHM